MNTELTVPVVNDLESFQVVEKSSGRVCPEGHIFVEDDTSPYVTGWYVGPNCTHHEMWWARA